MSGIGFDIGNESCVIAAAKRGGIDILLNDEAKRETPSVVSFGDKQRFLGAAGAAFATSNPKSTITQIKRLIGRLYDEPSVQKDLKLLPYATSKGPRGGILVELEYLNKKWTFSPVEILGMLFTHLMQIAKKNLEAPVVDCVIGIPSYFTDLQRREYLDAARISGLRPLRLIHDGTAIALGYGMYKTDFSKSGRTVVVFVDIGHCDTQVTVAAFKKGGMKILSHSFDPNLGGRDFDDVLFRHFAAQFKEKYKIDVNANRRASIRLRASCEKVKKVLSANAEAPISIECLIDDTDVRGLITRDEFEILSNELFERVTFPCRKAVDDSGVSIDKIHTIELVGSGSRIPAIMKILSKVFHKEPTRTLNASECVARGCALRCAMLIPSLQVRDYEIQDIFPYSIGFRPVEAKNKTPKDIMIFPQGSTLPKDVMINYHGSTILNFLVFYSNKMNYPAGVSPEVGHFMVCHSQNRGAERMRADIIVKLNEYGIVEIESASIVEDKHASPKRGHSLAEQMAADGHMVNDDADHKFTDSSPSTAYNNADKMRKRPTRRPTLEFSVNLDLATTEDELREAQKREKMLAEQDKKVEETKDQRNTLESFVYDTRSKLSSAYRSFATESEKKVITDSLQETEDWLYEDSDDESEQDYTGKLQDLKKLVDPIEKKYKDEKAKSEETKAFQTRIEKYRSAADSRPSFQKKEVNDECYKAEQWLNHAQQNLSTENVDPIYWSNLLKKAVEFFEWTCKNIMGLNPPSPSFSNHRHQPMEANQRDRYVDVNQRGRYVDVNQRGRYVETNQSDGYLVATQRNHHVNTNQRNQYVDPNQRFQYVVQEQRYRPVHSNQKDQFVDPHQRNPYGEINQTDQYVDANQRDRYMNAKQMYRYVDPNQGDQYVNQEQRYRSIDPAQSYRSLDPTQMYLSVDSNQRDQPLSLNQKDRSVDLNHRNQPMDSKHSNQPADSNNGDQTMDLNQKDQPVESNQPMDANQNDQSRFANKMEQSMGSNQTRQPAESNQRNQPEDLPQRSQQVDPNQRDQIVDSDLSDQFADLRLVD